MLTILLFIIILICLVYNSSLVIAGASNGLMLWYNNVLPILLPFMLVSNIIVNKISSLKHPDSSKSFYAFMSTFLLGLLCGYPLGAKTTADYVKSGIFSKKTGNILLPICNNCSPMFISGYVIHITLKNSISFGETLFFIYFPYIFYSLFIILFFHLTKKEKNQNSTPQKNNISLHANLKDTDLIMTSIVQITYVGVYIMICSIIIEFLLHLNIFSEYITPAIAGVTEITRGLSQISNYHYSDAIKKALILGVTSFGGLSAILQTYKVIKKSGLSLVYYIVLKTICGITTFYMMLLFF